MSNDEERERQAAEYDAQMRESRDRTVTRFHLEGMVRDGSYGGYPVLHRSGIDDEDDATALWVHPDGGLVLTVEGREPQDCAVDVALLRTWLAIAEEYEQRNPA